MDPKPQGSKISYGRGRMVESCKLLPAWRALVKKTALALHYPIFDGPISLHIVFLFSRPKTHFNSKGLKPDAPHFHTIRPDLSKIIRSTEDALQDAKLIHDDARICLCNCSKRYVMADESPGALITLHALPRVPAT